MLKSEQLQALHDLYTQIQPGVKDSEFSKTTSLNDSDTVAIVQEGGNRNVTIKELKKAVTAGTEESIDLDVINAAIAKKQDKLYSGQNIKTINGQSLLGTGNISIKSSGSGTTTDLPIASTTTLGGIKVGANLNITSDGVLSAIASGSSVGFGGTLMRYSAADLTETPDAPSVDSSIWHVERDTLLDNWFALGVYSSTTGQSTDDLTAYSWGVTALKALPADGKVLSGEPETTYGVSLSPSEVPTLWKGTLAELGTTYAGMYIWTKTVYLYTDGTSQTTIIPTYCGTNGTDGKDGTNGTDGSTVAIGNDGQWYIDGQPTGIYAKGADGTSVTIKNKLTSVEELPTTGNTLGDGYLIDGYLWVYTGVETVDDVDIKGFTNVGKIKGEDGNSVYVWFAYCESMTYDSAGNGTPKGFVKPTDANYSTETRYPYLGVATTTVNSRPPQSSDYTWSLVEGAEGSKGDPGEDGYSIHYAWATKATKVTVSTDVDPRGYTWEVEGGSTTAGSGEGYTYLGILRDRNINDDEDFTKYEWSNLKGDKGVGERGPAGDDGLVGCVHYAWCNGNPLNTTLEDSERFKDFTVEKKDGIQYTWMGLYIHYVPEDEIGDADSEDPYDYTVWKKVSQVITLGDDGWWYIDGDKASQKTYSRGPSLTYCGVFDKLAYYHGSIYRCDVVKWGEKYYMASPSISNDAEATFAGSEHIPGDTTGYWLSFGNSFNNIATGMIWANNAIVELLQAQVSYFNETHTEEAEIQVLKAYTAQIASLVADNITAGKIQTATSGSRIVTEGNKMVCYDDDGIPVIEISGEDDNITTSLDSVAYTWNAQNITVASDSYTEYTAGGNTYNSVALGSATIASFNKGESATLSGVLPTFTLTRSIMGSEGTETSSSGEEGAEAEADSSQGYYGEITVEYTLTWGTYELFTMAQSFAPNGVGDSVYTVGGLAFQTNLVTLVEDEDPAENLTLSIRAYGLAEGMLADISMNLTHATKTGYFYKSTKGDYSFFNGNGFSYTAGSDQYFNVTKVTNSGATTLEVNYKSGNATLKMDANSILFTVGSTSFGVDEYGPYKVISGTKTYL